MATGTPALPEWVPSAADLEPAGLWRAGPDDPHVCGEAVEIGEQARVTASKGINEGVSEAAAEADAADVVIARRELASDAP